MKKSNEKSPNMELNQEIQLEQEKSKDERISVEKIDADKASAGKISEDKVSLDKLGMDKKKADKKEAKKQRRKQSIYSRLNRHTKGFLCMLTFWAFVVSFAFTVYGVSQFGIGILTNWKRDYFQTTIFEGDIGNEAINLLYTIGNVNYENPNFTVTYIEEGTIVEYNGKELENLDAEILWDNSWESIRKNEDKTKGFVVNSRKFSTSELYKLSSLKQYLNSENAENNYLYFSDKAFRKLFEVYGLRNTNYRYSDEFSPDAYFLFDCNSEMLTVLSAMDNARNIISDMTYAVFLPSENLYYSTEDDYFEPMDAYVYDAQDLKYMLEERYDGEEDVLAEEASFTAVEENASDEEESFTAVEENVSDEEENFTAVEEDVSDEEENFAAVEENVSDEEENFTAVEENVSAGEEHSTVLEPDELEQPENEEYIEEDMHRVASIVFMLLRSENLQYDNENGIVDRQIMQAQIVEDARLQLESWEDSNFYYYFESPDFTSCNVDSVEEITNLEYAYCMNNVGGLNYAGAMEYDRTLSDAFESIIMDAYEYCPKDAVFYFGINPENIKSTDSSRMVDNLQRFTMYNIGAKICVVLAVVTFILLMMQAVAMIRATGKRNPEDTVIFLNWYDKLPTEVWLMIYVVIMCLCLCVNVVVGYPETIYNYLAVSGAAMPFGFFFMILTLSLARRVKAKNLWKGSILYKVIRKLIGKHTEEENRKPKGRMALVVDRVLKRAKNVFCGIKGTHKLVILCVLYMIVLNWLCMWSNIFGGGVLYLLFTVLQIAAIGVVVWVVREINQLIHGVNEITKGNLDYKVNINEKISVFGELADGINHIGDGLKNAVETSIKDERMKTELITNVSHDLKTPLTSIINYVDLLKKEEIPGEDAKHYIEVLDTKSQRLKQLTEDLVEAAKATSGNIELEMMPLTFDELMKQALGEFEDKFENRNLTVIANYPEEPAVIMADGRRLFRIIDNVLQNVYKYALEGTRVYVDLEKNQGMVIFTLKNISASPLNISPDELMERFTRGDSSRTTEGSGLGLSIAKDLTRLQNGQLEIQLDGDLFKVIIQFPQHFS